jgi:hypothetical protein
LQLARTVPAVSTRDPRWAARRRKRHPRDYLVHGHDFGRRDTTFHVPVGGDAFSRDAARHQHQVVRAWRAGYDGSDRQAAQKWNVTTSSWSRSMLGQRWLETGLMNAMLDELGVIDHFIASAAREVTADVAVARRAQRIPLSRAEALEPTTTRPVSRRLEVIE